MLKRVPFSPTTALRLLARMKCLTETLRRYQEPTDTRATLAPETGGQAQRRPARTKRRDAGMTMSMEQVLLAVPGNVMFSLVSLEGNAWRASEI